MLEGSALGPYHVLEELGRGGMGVVYRAVDPRSGEEVALKVLTSQKAGKRFEREVGSLARVQHGNVVPVLNCGIYMDHPWVAMAFVPGVTLQQRLEQRGPVTPGLAVSWIAKLARALAAVHEAGVVHRDIKPANVILTPTGEPVLTDFGLALDATATERLSMDGATLGSPGYFSPEQAVGDLSRIDARSDVYGLGATLYALLTERAPIPPRGSLVEVIVATQEQAPQPPSSWNQRVDRELDRICLACLAKQPEHRPSSALALALELERYLHDGQVKPRARWALGLWIALPALALAPIVAAAWVVLDADAPPSSRVQRGADLPAAEAQLAALGEAYDAKRYGEVLEALAPFAEDPHASPELLLLLARAHGQLKDYGASLEVAQRLIREAPSAKAYLVYGTVLMGLGRGEESLAAFDRGLELGPTRATEGALLSNRAMCRMQNDGDPQLCLADWERALTLVDPEDLNAERYFNLGVLRVMAEQPERAVEAYTRCLEFDASYAPALYNLGVILSQLDRVDEAERTLLQLQQLDPQFANLEFRLALLDMRRAETQARSGEAAPEDALRRALAHFDAHLRRDPRDGAGYHARGMCRLRLGDAEQAQADLEQAVTFSSGPEAEAIARQDLERVKRVRAAGEY